MAEKKMVAGYVPKSLHSRFSLYTTLHNIPRSSIIELVVSKLLEDAPDSSALIEQIAQKCVEEFNGSGSSDWKRWERRYEKWLSGRKMDAKTIKTILKLANVQVRETSGTN